MIATQTLPVRPSFWPYALIGWFVIFIAAIAAFITWAVGQNMDLVRDDYYDHEIRFQQQIDRLNRTAPLKNATRVEFDYAAQKILVTLPGAHANATGTIHFYRPSNARLDREEKLSVSEGATQQLDARGLESGLWKIGVHWKAGNEDYYFEKPVVVGRD